MQGSQNPTSSDTDLHCVITVIKKLELLEFMQFVFYGYFTTSAQFGMFRQFIARIARIPEASRQVSENHWPLRLAQDDDATASGVRRWMSFSPYSRVFPCFYGFSRLANFAGRQLVAEKWRFRYFGDRFSSALQIIACKRKAADTSKREKDRGRRQRRVVRAAGVSEVLRANTDDEKICPVQFTVLLKNVLSFNQTSSSLEVTSAIEDY